MSQKKKRGAALWKPRGVFCWDPFRAEKRGATGKGVNNNATATPRVWPASSVCCTYGSCFLWGRSARSLWPALSTFVRFLRGFCACRLADTLHAVSSTKIRYDTTPAHVGAHQKQSFTLYIYICSWRKLEKKKKEKGKTTEKTGPQPAFFVKTAELWKNDASWGFYDTESIWEKNGPCCIRCFYWYTKCTHPRYDMIWW